MTIYLDNNATTAIDPDFLDNLFQMLKEVPMNGSSVHTFGQKGKKIIQSARLAIAQYLSVQPGEITFTSGGTESLNQLIFGLIQAEPHEAIITTKLEHACVYELCLELKKLGFPVVFLDVGLKGRLSSSDLAPYSNLKKIAVITSSVNSETGALLDLPNLAKFCDAHRSTLILDGVAHLGKEPLSLLPGITAMGFSSHKIHAPKGAGFYFLKQGTPFSKTSFGGPQEFNRRAGTENIFSIYGLYLAIEKLKKSDRTFFSYLAHLKNHFLNCLKQEGVIYEINGIAESCSNLVNLHFPGIDGETLLIQLDQAQVLSSMGSACSSGGLEPSRVLIEMGYSKARAKSSLRFSFSRLNTLKECEEAAHRLALCLSRSS